MDELLRRARRGDGDAFAEILGRYEAGMYRAAYGCLRNEPDALDAVQEAAYRAFRGLGRLKEPRYIGTWLTRITINCAMDILRKRGRTAELDALPRDSLPQLAYTDTGLERLELRDMLNALDDDERRLVGMKYIDGSTFSEIADAENMPLGSVKTKLYRALAKLRKRAKEDEK